MLNKSTKIIHRVCKSGEKSVRLCITELNEFFCLKMKVDGITTCTIIEDLPELSCFMHVTYQRALVHGNKPQLLTALSNSHHTLIRHF